MEIRDSGKLERIWTIRRFPNERAFRAWRPMPVRDAVSGLWLPPISIFRGNLLLNEGIAALWDLAITTGATKFDNTNANIGVGDGGPTALTGTLAVTNGSTAVTGSGTAFTTELAVGDFIFLDTQATVLAKVASITNNTALVLTANYAGTTASGQAASKVLRELATQTGLQASTNKVYRTMAATYPSRAAQTVTWRGVFTGSDANYAWREFTVANGTSDSASNLNRKVDGQGAKANGQTWTLDLAVTLS